MAYICKFCETVYGSEAELNAHQEITGHTGKSKSDDGYSLKDVLLFGPGAISGAEKKKHKGKKFAWSWRA
jgi:hypothetical protein